MPLSWTLVPAPAKVIRLKPLLIWIVPAPMASLTAVEALPLIVRAAP